MRFNITEKEYHDFMECVDLWSYDAAKEFLTGVLPLSRLSFKIRRAENRDYARHSYIKFYAGKIAAGILYLLFFWTCIPAIIAFIEFILALCKTEDSNGNILV